MKALIDTLIDTVGVAATVALIVGMFLMPHVLICALIGAILYTGWVRLHG